MLGDQALLSFFFLHTQLKKKSSHSYVLAFEVREHCLYSFVDLLFWVAFLFTPLLHSSNFLFWILTVFLSYPFANFLFWDAFFCPFAAIFKSSFLTVFLCYSFVDLLFWATLSPFATYLLIFLSDCFSLFISLIFFPLIISCICFICLITYLVHFVYFTYSDLYVYFA